MKIGCVSVVNDLYFKGFITFFYSLVKNTPSFNLDYVVLDDNISEKNKLFLKNLYSRFIFKSIDRDAYSMCNFNTQWRQWTINCGYVFDIFELSEYDKIVFFDSDMLVLKDVSYLFTIDCEFGACKVHDSVNINQNILFNSGVMVISKNLINKENKKALISLSEQNNFMGYEPALNILFKDITFIDKTFNILTSELNFFDFEEIKILHFSGSNKPWDGVSLKEKFDPFVFSQTGNIKLLVKSESLYKQYFEEVNALGRSSSSFLMEYSAPKIELANIKQFKNDKNSNLFNKINARLEELRREYRELEELYNFNNFVEKFEYNFVPVSGHTYYMYENEGKFFMSLISPEDFIVKYKFFGSCRFNGLGYFEKLE